MLRNIILGFFLLTPLTSFSDLPLCGVRSEEHRHDGGTLGFRLSLDGQVQEALYLRLSEVLSERDRLVKTGACALEPGIVCVMQVNPASSFTYQMMSKQDRWSERYFDVSDALVMQRVLLGSKICSALDNKSNCEMIEEPDSANGSRFTVYRGQELLAPPFLSMEDAENFLIKVRGQRGLCQ